MQSTHTPETVLVVDDHEYIRDLLVRQLRSLGYRAMTAVNGRDALVVLHNEPADLILLDMMMPVMSGYQVLERIKQMPHLRHIPVIAISADTDQDSIARCIKAGADDYLTKPFNFVLLQARVFSSLEKKRLRDGEQAYIQARLRRLGSGTMGPPIGHEIGDALNAALRTTLEELEQVETARRHAEEELRQLNERLEELVEERTALAEQRAESLRKSEERYALAAQATNDGLWDWDLVSDQVFFAPRWKAMLGYSEQELTTQPGEWLLRIHPDDRESVQLRLSAHLKRLLTNFEHEYRIQHRDGTYRWMICRGLAVWNEAGRAVRAVGAQTDITERKLAEQQLIYDALHDGLTGLANRTLLLERLGQVILRCQRNTTEQFAVLFFDLDRFKVINDSMGHLIGDQLLIGIARRIQTSVRAGDTFARLGGDEFTILLENVQNLEEVTSIAERILQMLEMPFVLAGQEIFTGASIGIALSQGSSYQRPDDMLRDADAAMYHAKMQGKGRYVLFDSSMHDRALAMLQLETDLRRGLERGELNVHYQPIVVLSTNHVVGFEALARWYHPERGLIPPSDFIPLAEETGLIGAIGEMILRSACQQMGAWHTEYPSDPPLTIHVNLSPRQMQRGDLVALVRDVLQETGIPPQSLTLEITENSLIAQGEGPTGLLERLHDLGVQLCIDDFGTGYSSLSYLHRFPIDSLKIDRSFIHQMGTNAENLELVRTIVALTHSLGIAAVAEGTETAAQLDQLRDLACKYAQGWAFGAAVDATQAGLFLLNMPVSLKPSP